MRPTSSRLWPCPSMTVVVCVLALCAAPRVSAHVTPEHPAPDSCQSGSSLSADWACKATSIENAFHCGPPHRAAYGTNRGDTAQRCGLLFNRNLSGNEIQAVTARADGVEIPEAVGCGESNPAQCLSGCKTDGAEAGLACLSSFVECINGCQWDRDGDGQVSAKEDNAHRVCTAPCRTGRRTCMGEAYRTQQACVIECNGAVGGEPENSI